MEFNYKYGKTHKKYKDINLSIKEVKKIVKKHTNFIKKHMKEEGYPIDADFIISDILYDIFGTHFEELIYSEFCKDDIHIRHKYNNGLSKATAVKTSGYFPMYYDSYTGDIIVIDDKKMIESKKYISKYTESKGYINLGCL